jgi:hypothetical protein
MRVHHSLQIVTVVTTFAALAACSSNRRVRNQPDPAYSTVTLQWDSGPLDRSYNSERVDMEARHNQENSYPRADESSDQRVRRQSSETQDLDRRYAQGKAAHAKTMPPSDQDHHDKSHR